MCLHVGIFLLYCLLKIIFEKQLLLDGFVHQQYLKVMHYNGAIPFVPEINTCIVILNMKLDFKLFSKLSFPYYYIDSSKYRD